MLERRELLAVAALSPVALASGRAVANALQPALTKFRTSLKGELILPADPAYELARRTASFSPATDRHPLMIVRCACADDVIRTLEFAHRSSLGISVKSGGHDVLGDSVTDGCVVIDTSLMKTVAFDKAAATARVGAGVRSGELNIAAEPLSLAPVLGCNPAVGISGLTLGGGLGWFLGTHGAACDHLVGADLVCADGTMQRVSAEENPDLFWAIRGGGGNFGIAINMDLKLIAADRVLGGALAFQTDIAKFLAFYRDFMAAAPDALTIELNFFAMEKPVVLAIVCWSGDPGEGEKLLLPLRKFGTPLFDSIRSVSYAHLTDRPSDGRQPPKNLFWLGGSLESLSDDAIAQLSEIMQTAPPGWSIGMGHYMHGAICRSEPGSTPLIRRPGQFTYFIGAGWNPPEQSTQMMGWVTAAITQMRAVSSPSTYVNYLSDNSESAVAAAYGQNYSRLIALKRQYDPTNVFRHNRNIRP